MPATSRDRRCTSTVACIWVDEQGKNPAEPSASIQASIALGVSCPHAAPAELRAKASACSRSLRSRRGTRGGRCSFKVAPRASRAPIAKLAFGEAPAIALGNVSAAVALATETRATARRARVGAVGMTGWQSGSGSLRVSQIRASPCRGVRWRRGETIKSPCLARDDSSCLPGRVHGAQRRRRGST